MKQYKINTKAVESIESDMVAELLCSPSRLPLRSLYSLVMCHRTERGCSRNSQ